MTRGLFAALVAVLVVGCRPPDPKEVAAKTSADVKALVREAYDTGAQTNDWRSVDEAFVSTGMASSPASRPRLAPVTSLDSGLDEYSKLLARVFTEENVVSSAGGATVFKVRGADVCTGPSGQAPAPACVEQVDKLELKLKASGDLDLTLQVGPGNIEPLTLKIRTGKSLAIETDLAQAQRAALFINDTLSTSGAGSVQVTASGRVELRLEKNGAQDFTFVQAITAPVSVLVTGTDGVQRTVKLAAKNPLSSIRVEAPARRLTVLADAGNVELRGLYNDLFAGTANGPAELLLSGFSGTLVIEDGKAHSLKRFGFGSGQSVFRYKGQDAFTFDFNASRGRTADFAWTSDASGLKLTVSPGLEVHAVSRLALLEPDLGTDVVKKEWRNARYDASFTAPAGQTPTVELLAATTTRSARLRLATGELALAVDDPAVAPRVFTGPICLEASSSSATTNAIVESLQSRSCD